VIDNSPAPSRLVNADALPNRVFPAQPSRTQNVSVTFIDRIVNLDAEGKALDPVRIATLTIPAKMKGSETRGTILFCAYVSDRAVPGPYGVSVHASANMERKVRIDPPGTATVEESWEFRSQDGDSIQLQMQYVRCRPLPARRKQSSTRRSSRNSTASTGPSSPRMWCAVRQLTGFRKFSSKPLPKLSPLFDGSEQLIGVTSNPWYTRQTFLPAS
jgi:hypothetical protein